MKLGVVGAGAIGGWIAAKLAASGRPVSVLARGETLAAIGAKGLIFHEDGRSIAAPVRASDRAADLGAQDVLVIAVKAPALAAAAAAAAAMLSPSTIIVPMLNGVPWWFLADRPELKPEAADPGGVIARCLPLAQVIGSVVHAACSLDAPGEVRRNFGNGLILGEPAGGSSDRVREAAAIFAGAGIDVTVSAAIQQDIWYKLWGNMTMNPISALTRATSHQMLDDPLIAAFALAIMDEAARIGAAIGCPIAESGRDRMQVTRRLGAFKTSMLQDVEAGRAIEIDALLTAPREIGERAGIATPNMDALLGLLRVFDGVRNP